MPASSRSNALHLVHVFLAVCDAEASLAMSAIRSVHRSTIRYRYAVHLHILHARSKEALYLRHAWASSQALNITRLRFEWHELGSTDGPCASARLQLPHYFPDVEAGIFLDCDVFVHGDLSHLSGITSRFTATQWGAFALDDAAEDSRRLRTSAHDEGAALNIGVFLFNATRWRDSSFYRFAHAHAQNLQTWQSEQALYVGSTRTNPQPPTPNPRI